MIRSQQRGQEKENKHADTISSFDAHRRIASDSAMLTIPDILLLSSYQSAPTNRDNIQTALFLERTITDEKSSGYRHIGAETVVAMSLMLLRHLKADESNKDQTL